jgi:hypothetical protein
MVRTSAGEKKVTYHSYMHIPYVANPVDKDYQSLNVSVPVKVDDKDIDASDAPIIFDIGVGGYLSVNNARSGMSDIPGGAGRCPGNAGGISRRICCGIASACFSLQQATGNKNAEIESEVKELVNMMNAMYFLRKSNRDCADYEPEAFVEWIGKITGFNK